MKFILALLGGGVALIVAAAFTGFFGWYVYLDLRGRWRRRHWR